jgi:hypothetical protein
MMTSLCHKSLATRIREVEQLLPAIDFEEDIDIYRYPPSEAAWLRGSAYYKGLAGFAKLLPSQKALEIGTLFGGSAIALAKFSKSVVAVDVDLSRVVTTLFSRNIEPLICTDFQACLSISLSGVDMIFVDIDHSGKVEAQLHERFCNEFCGVVFYDDIDLNDGMRAFWHNIDNEKVATDWHRSGFGAVRYGD